MFTLWSNSKAQYKYTSIILWSDKDFNHVCINIAKARSLTCAYAAV